jgi:hypothetical protein
MATASEVKSGLDEIAAAIKAVRTRFATAKSSIEGGATALGNLPTKYSDVLTTIDGYTGADAFEQLAQAEKSRLTNEFIALKAELDALIAAQEFGG